MCSRWRKCSTALPSASRRKAASTASSASGMSSSSCTSRSFSSRAMDASRAHLDCLADASTAFRSLQPRLKIEPEEQNASSQTERKTDQLFAGAVGQRGRAGKLLVHRGHQPSAQIVGENELSRKRPDQELRLVGIEDEHILVGDRQGYREIELRPW